MPPIPEVGLKLLKQRGHQAVIGIFGGFLSQFGADKIHL